jgi:hypothetical protein
MAERKRARGAGSDTPPPQVCALPKLPERRLPAGLHPGRTRLIRLNEKKWVNGTALTYFFFDRPSDGESGAWVGPEDQKAVVRRAFQHWKALGLGLEFREAQDREEAEIRIGFDRRDGSWSYVGRDAIDVASDPDERTMNFGWDLITEYGWETALHEIGHALGFPHEHQNPNSNLVWDEPAVLDYFAGPPNRWDEETTRWNILRTLPRAGVSGTEWDPDSIMHYAFPAGLIERPEQYRGGLRPAPGLSERDEEAARVFYPAEEASEARELRALESQRLVIAPSQQADFVIRPRLTRTYALQTFGDGDTVMVLFVRRGDGSAQYVEGDDDSGHRRNARIRARLYRGSEYLLRVRLYFAHSSGETAVMMW